MESPTPRYNTLTALVEAEGIDSSLPMNPSFFPALKLYVVQAQHFL